MVGIALRRQVLYTYSEPSLLGRERAPPNSALADYNINNPNIHTKKYEHEATMNNLDIYIYLIHTGYKVVNAVLLLGEAGERYYLTPPPRRGGRFITN